MLLQNIQGALARMPLTFGRGEGSHYDTGGSYLDAMNIRGGGGGGGGGGGSH